MATTTQINAVNAEIMNGVQLAGTLAGVIDPALIPFIVLGKAAAVAEPALVNDIAGLINGGDPTAAENQALATKIAALASPESL